MQAYLETIVRRRDVRNLQRSFTMNCHFRTTLAAVILLALATGIARGATVTWSGGVNSTWDTSTANWTGDSTTYTDGYDVVFNDSGNAAGVRFPSTGYAVSPASTTFNNVSDVYGLYPAFSQASTATINGPIVLNNPVGNPVLIGTYYCDSTQKDVVGLHLAGSISGTGGLQVGTAGNTYQGRIQLSGDNSFSGGFTVPSTVNQFRLLLSSATALGTGKLTWNGGQVITFPADATIANAIDLFTSGSQPKSVSFSGTGITLTGDITLGGTTTVGTGTYQGKATTLAGRFLGNQALSLGNINYDTTIFLTGDNTGLTSLTAGTAAGGKPSLGVGHAKALGGGTAFLGTNGGATLSLFSVNAHQALANPITLNGNIQVGGGGYVGTEFNYSSSAYDLTLDGDISGAGKTITKLGSGNALYLNGTVTAASLTVSAGTLGGSGTIQAPVTLSAGTISPGNSVGTLTTGNLTMANGTTYRYEAGDLVDVNGLLDLPSGAWTIDLLGSGLQEGGSLTLFTFDSWDGDTAGSPIFNPIGWTLTGTPSLSVDLGSKSIILNGVSLIPEPASAVLLGLTGLALLRRRARQV